MKTKTMLSMKNVYTILLPFTLVILSGCIARAPISIQKAISDITVSKDSYDNSTEIESPLYLSRKGLTDTFPVRIKLRARYEGSERSFIQLVVSVTHIDWGFYYSANGEDGTKLALTDIDKSVSAASAYYAITTEFVGLEIPMDYLESMSKTNFSIKLYGKNREGDFIVPKSMTQAFLRKLKCHESNNCT